MIRVNIVLNGFRKLVMNVGYKYDNNKSLAFQKYRVIEFCFCDGFDFKCHFEGNSSSRIETMYK